MNKRILLITATATILSLAGYALPALGAAPADFGLKEGDVISAAGSDDPDVYIVNELGYKRLFLNPVIFNFYGHLGGFAAVKNVTPATRDAFPTSGLFRNCETNDQKVYAVEVTGEDTGILHHVDVSGQAAVQQDPDFFKKIFCINNNESQWYSRSSVAYTSLAQIPVYQRGGPAPTPLPPIPSPTPVPATWNVRQVTSAAGASRWSSLAGNGSGFGVVWLDDRDGGPAVYFAFLDKTGAKSGGDTRLASAPQFSAEYAPDIIWDGSRFVIAFASANNVFLARVNSAGARVGGDIVFDTGCHPRVSSRGTSYALVQQTPCGAGGNLYFSYTDQDGVKLVDRQFIIQGGDAETRVFPHETSFGVVYNAAGAAMFTRVEINGNKIVNNLSVANSPAAAGAWNGQVYGALSTPDRYFAFDKDGVPAATVKMLFPFSLAAPDMAWDGSMFGVMDGQRFFSVLPNGTYQQESRITNNTVFNGRIARTDDRYGTVWDDGSEIFFATDK